MKYLTLCIIVLLFKSLLTSSDMNIPKIMLDTVLNALPMISKLSFDLSYSQYNVNIGNVRIFKALTPTIEIKSLQHSIEVKDITMTIACNLKISMQREYNYNDFLIQFKITNMILTEDLIKRKYTVEELTLDKMFISKLHDVVSSNTFKQFTQDDLNILAGLRGLLIENFNEILFKQNLYHFDMIKILDKLQATLKNYEISIPFQFGFSLKKVTANSYVIDRTEEPPKGILLLSYVKFVFSFTVKDVNTGETRELEEVGSFFCNKSIMYRFTAYYFRSSTFSEETANEFYKKVFNQLFDKYSKEQEEEEDRNNKEDDYKGIFYDL